jgi:outer membrane protein assembly factor BamD (BamD/ComL family)
MRARAYEKRVGGNASIRPSAGRALEGGRPYDDAMPVARRIRLGLAFAVLAGSVDASVTGRTALAAPDPVRTEYDAVLLAFKAEKWAETRSLAARFVAAHPDYKHAHSALYMSAEAAYSLRLFADVVADVDRYRKSYGGQSYESTLALLRARALFKLRRGAEAKEAFDAIIALGSAEKTAAEARAWRARIDPQDRVVRGMVVLDYDGKFAKDPRLSAAMAEVERLAPAALDAVRARLDLPAGSRPPCRIRFRDTGERPDTVDMQTIEELSGTDVVQALVVRTERLLTRQYDVQTTLTHELTHVWHRHALGEPYYGVPKWAREGLALWVAKQGPERLRALYNLRATDPSATDAVEPFVNGLAGKHTLDDYGEDWLAFAWVESTKGESAVRALGRSLLESADVEGAFAKASGLPFAEAAVRMRAFAEKRVRDDLSVREAYFVPRRLLLAKKFSEAASAYQAMLAEAPDHVLAPAARLDRALALLRAGRTDDAEAAFAAIEKGALSGLYHDDAAEYAARIAAERRDGARLAAAKEAFVRDFSWVDSKRLARVRALTAGPAATPQPPSPPPEPPDDAPRASDDDR